MDNNTRLDLAAENGDEASVRQCIEAGAKVDWRWLDGHSKDGQTALHAAAWEGHTNVVRILVDSG